MHRGLYGAGTPRVRSALVGRAAELARLRGLFERACGGEATVALVWGEAGVGKTRLLREFAAIAREAGARVAGSACYEAACPPFAPLLQVFEKFGIGETLGAGGPPWPTPAVAEAAKFRRFVAAQRALSAASREEPVVALIDDLQWADLASLECIEYLARSLGDARVLLLAAVRSDDIERDAIRLEPIAKLRREATETLDLRPLGSTEMEVLLTNLWPPGRAPSAGDFERIRALAEGKPYFAEELVNSALAADVDDVDPQTPLSIRAGVLGRFGRLEPSDRSVLRYAAVIGNRFDAVFLAALADEPLDAVLRVLATARDLRLVREVAGDASGRFGFHHAITREVIYRELLAVEARRVHRAIAERLERDSDGDAAQLAYHWDAAGDAERASDANERAADVASERNAYRDAVQAYLRAVAAAPPAGRRYANLCEKLSRALSIEGDLTGALVWGRRAVDAYVACGEHKPAASLALRISRRAWEAGDPAEAAATARRVLAWLAGANDQASAALRLDACTSLAHFAALQGRPDEALGHLADAEAVMNDPPEALRHSFHLVRAFVRSMLGPLAQAFEDYEEALRLAREAGNDERLVWTLNNYATRALVTGRIGTAIDAYREAVELAERCGFGKIISMAAQGLALALIFTGELEAAETAHACGLEFGPGSVLTQVTAAAVGVRLAHLRADDERGQRYASDEIIELAFASGETQNIVLLAGALIEFFDANGRRREAAALRARAMARVKNSDLSFWLLDRCALSDDAEEVRCARGLLENAARDGDNTAGAAHLLLFEARVLRRASKRRAAAALATEAARLFESIGWPWERGQALEIARRPAEALELYGRLGYLRDAERLARERRRLRHRPHAQHLTPRESEVAHLAVDGLTNRLIAERLGIGERTVETHIAALFDRFDLTSRSELATLLERAAAAERTDGR